MKQIFADTFYWIALTNSRDNWHQRVLEFTATLDRIQIITIDEVLTEVLNLNIEEILTHDKHFTQEGFTILFQDT